MRKLSTGLLCMLAVNAQANVIQYFAGISYSNPADLFKVQKETFLIGGTGSYADLSYKGSVFNFNTLQYDSGISNSRTYTLMPYGRVAKRLNDKIVFGVDVTEPFNSNLNWGTLAFTNYACTQNYLWDVDVSPRMSYGINDKLQVGVGLDLNFLLLNEVDWAFPTGPNTWDKLINKTSSVGLGYDLGATYMVTKMDILGLTYYSRIRQNSKGTSTLANFLNEDLVFSFSLPATTVLSYVHIFNQKWLVNLQGFRTEWNANQYARFYNTAAPPPFTNFIFTMHFDASYAVLAAVRNQFSEKLGLTLVGLVDDGPEKADLRPITFPSDVQYFLGVSADYHFTKQSSMELLFGHVFSHPPINNFVTVNNNKIPFCTGQININANVVDLKFKVEA